MTTETRAEKFLHRTVIEPPRHWFRINFRELWEYRELCFMLALREVQLRYRQTFLGITWVILQPLMTTAVFTLIFGGLMHAKSDNVPYELFSFVGLLPWNLFSGALQRAGTSLTRDLRLITKIFFPRIIIPISVAISTLVDFMVSLAVMIVLLFIYKIPLTFNLFLIVVFLFFTLLLSIGVGIAFAALNVYYRDFAYMLPFVIQIWMFASPLAYSANIIPQSWTWIYNLNPVVGIINGFRWAVFGSTPFPLGSVLYSVALSTIIFLIGWAIFQRLERRFADVI